MDFLTHHKVFKYINDWVRNKSRNGFDYNVVCAAVKFHFSLPDEDVKEIVKDWYNAQIECAKKKATEN